MRKKLRKRGQKGKRVFTRDGAAHYNGIGEQVAVRERVEGNSVLRKMSVSSCSQRESR